MRSWITMSEWLFCRRPQRFFAIQILSNKKRQIAAGYGLRQQYVALAYCGVSYIGIMQNGEIHCAQFLMVKKIDISSQTHTRLCEAVRVFRDSRQNSGEVTDFVKVYRKLSNILFVKILVCVQDQMPNKNVVRLTANETNVTPVNNCSINLL